MKILLLLLLTACSTVSEYKQGCLDSLEVENVPDDIRQDVCTGLENKKVKNAQNARVEGRRSSY